MPLTFAGLPASVAPAVLLLGIGILLVGMFAGYPVIGFTAAIVTSAAISVYVAVRTGIDPHFLKANAQCRRFWTGRKRRVYLAGAPNDTSAGGRRS